MATLIVPPLDEQPWATLGPQVCDFIEERAIFGPGSLKGQAARLSDEKRAIIYRAYEIYPREHALAGRRRFKRVGWSVRKGLAKTEVLSWIAYAELHPEAEVRFDGWDAYGDPVGRPVNSPYIPLLAYTKDQTEELAYGSLFTVVTEGPDADLFDAGLDRIIRLDDRGREDGKAVPLAGSPNAADGARTTFQGFDEPHRLYLPRLHEAHSTMSANLPKRPMEDAWSLYVGTAGQPGQGSIAEDLHHEAMSIGRGEVADPRIFYMHRDAGQVHRGDKETGHNLKTIEGRIEAITEATGPEGEYGHGQFSDIAEQWDRPRADHAYLERVWLNLWTQSARQAFDPMRQSALILPESTPSEKLLIPRGSLVTAGFDGARFKDSTGIVITDVDSGMQQLWALWERPLDQEEWEINEDEVSSSVAQLMSEYEVWRFNGDPPHWTETLGVWAGKWDCVEEWWTHRTRQMAFAVRDYYEAMGAGTVTYARDDRLALNSPVDGETMTAALSRHIAAAGRVDVNLYDDEGMRLWTLDKLHESRKFDACMAAILSWQARLEALKKGAKKARRRSTKVKRLR